MAGKRIVSSVDLSTNGFCFLCLNVVSTSENELRSLSSLTTLFTRVGINIDKLFEAETSKSEDYCRGRSTTIEASLCEECSKINGNIIELSRVIELAVMKINYNVDSIKRKMEAGRRPERIIRYQRRMKSDLSGSRLAPASMKKADEIRERLLSNCEETISRSKFQPCVKVRKLPDKPSNSSKSKIRRTLQVQEKSMGIHFSPNIKVGGSELSQQSRLLHLDFYNEPLEEQTANNETDYQSSGDANEDEIIATESAANIQRRKLPEICKICQNTFSTRFSLRRHHTRKHFNLEDVTSKRHKCVICAETFDDESMLHRHKSLSCSKPRAIHPSPQTAEHSNFQSQTDFIQVSYGQSVSNAEEGAAPTNNSTGPLIPQCFTLQQLNWGTDNAAADQSQRTSLPVNKAICHICGKLFKSNSNLKKHHRFVHLNEREFKCDHCGKRFTDKGILSRHQKSVHDRIQVKCNISGCERTYMSKCTLEFHQKTVHYKELLSEMQNNSSSSGGSTKESGGNQDEFNLPS